jgi:hypothetical protein
METAKGGAPNIGAAYEITVFDKDGKVKQVVKSDAKCFVMNFLRMIRHWCLNNGGTNNYTNFRNLSGSIVGAGGVRINSGYGSFGLVGLAGDLTKGIVVGTDATAVTDDDYKVGIIINHGTGPGQFLYDDTAVTPFAEAENVMTLSASRIVSNSTSDAITFSEIALYGLGTITVMLLRDVISPSVTIQPSESALIVYKIIING